MNILEIAKECGAFGGYTDLTHSKLYTIFKDEQLQAFAQAVIENYKAGLVPVAYIDKNSAGQISMKSYYGDCFDMSKFVGSSLYALKETDK